MLNFSRVAAYAVACMFYSHVVNAAEIQFADITVGEMGCQAMYDKAVAAKSVKGEPFVSAVTNGPAIELTSRAFGYDFVQSGYVLCTEEKVVDAITLTIPKKSASDIAAILAEKYEQQSYNLPQLGSGKAVYVSPTGETEAVISYQHVSFSADLTIYTKGFSKRLAEYRAEKAEQQKQKKASAF